MTAAAGDALLASWVGRLLEAPTFTRLQRAAGDALYIGVLAPLAERPGGRAPDWSADAWWAYAVQSAARARRLELHELPRCAA